MSACGRTITERVGILGFRKHIAGDDAEARIAPAEP